MHLSVLLACYRIHVAWSFTNWRDKRRLERLRPRVQGSLWDEAWDKLPLLWGFSPEEENALEDMTLLFLHQKTLEGAAGLEITEEMGLMVGLQACLPVLHLGLDWYRDWVSVILYPDEFVPEREWVDEAGVVWVSHEPHTGEAWERGPVILSWSEVAAGSVLDGVNVVLHEFAHKLDMLDGVANGHPPLHRDMSNARWAEVFSDAYGDFSRRVDAGEETDIDPYAAESPGEFFAVFTEAFFELPDVLKDEYPALYEQMSAFYRQDPLTRLTAAGVLGEPPPETPEGGQS